MISRNILRYVLFSLYVIVVVNATESNRWFNTNFKIDSSNKTQYGTYLFKCKEGKKGHTCGIDENICKNQQNLEINQNHREKRNNIQADIACNKRGCPTGFLCADNKCRCPKHLTGPFCQVSINYCTSSPCRHHAKCVSKLGGYICLCPNSYIGVHCEIHKNKLVKPMRNPRFQYAGFQYENILTTYEFFAESPGNWPKVEVDYGDGNKQKYTYGQKLVHSKQVEKTFNEILSLGERLFSGKFSLKFQHAYNKTGLYIVKVKAWNRFYLVFDRDYEIEVREPKNCTFSLHIPNSASNPNTSIKYLRSDIISMASLAELNCPKSSIVYIWTIKTILANTSVDYFLPNGSINFNLSYLVIPPFLIDFGKYKVILKATMVKPKEVLQEAVAYFEVLRTPAVVHIDGGSNIKANPDSSFYLDAKFSYDPNYSKKEQSKMVFKWKCNDTTRKEVFSICEGQNGSVLVIPEGNLQPKHSYLVELVVSRVGDSLTEIEECGGRGYVRVTVNEKSQPLAFIKCISNCFGNKINPHRATAFLGVTSSVTKGNASKNHQKETWDVLVAASKGAP